MDVFTGILVTVAGLVFGSFLNVCIARLPFHQSIVSPPSRCPHCRAPISPSDNIPILSFLLLRGHCRNCRSTISWRYPAIEVATAALWLLCWLRYGLSIQAAGMAVFSFLLLGLAAMDAETLTLPNVFTLPGIALGIAYSGLLCGRLRCAILSAGWAAAAAAILLVILALYWLLRRRLGMGIGDVKLLAMIAAWLGGAQAVLVLLLASVFAATWGIGLSVARKRLDAEAPLPFGSFLCLAAIYSIFYGRQILDWYLRFFR
jgi:leader peptidase (prepilin peptidase)/N-methyltransferase